MNLLKAFARIKILFTRSRSAELSLLDLNNHLRRDLGLLDRNSDRRVHERPIRSEIIIASSRLSRGP